jgi:rhodanese-related sulfurtransferase
MRRMKLPCATAAIVLLCSISLGAEHTDDSLERVKQNLAAKKAVLIDVRETGEWKRGHLKDAQLVPLSELKKLPSDPAVAQKVDKALPKDRIIYCHCAGGVRVLPAADILGKLGYDIRPLSAGYGDLLEAGFEPAANP